MKKKINITIFLVILLLVSLAGNYFLYSNGQSKENLYKNILSLGVDTENEQKGNEYYDDEVLSYEMGNYKQAISDCERARKYWGDYTQDLRDEKERISNFEEEVFKIYTDLISSEIKIYNNMYEACEYFESASRQFDYYYLETTSYNDVSFDKGNDYIESGNEKIKAHDEEVEIYNTLLAKYDSELDRLADIK